MSHSPRRNLENVNGNRQFEGQSGYRHSLITRMPRFLASVTGLATGCHAGAIVQTLPVALGISRKFSGNPAVILCVGAKPGDMQFGAPSPAWSH